MTYIVHNNYTLNLVGRYDTWQEAFKKKCESEWFSICDSEEEYEELCRRY